MKELGVERVLSGGKTEVGGVKVLGKGHTGIVVRCRWNGKAAALKVRRIDAGRDSLEAEGEVLRVANRSGLGPQVYAVSPDFIVMEELQGASLIDWLEGSEGLPVGEFKDVIAGICDQARLLDVAGIDHKELTNPRHHVIIRPDGKASVLDFETASVGGRNRNVNSLLQYLTLSKPFGEMILAKLGADRDEVLAAFRTYRRTPGERSFMLLLAAMKLTARPPPLPRAEVG